LKHFLRHRISKEHNSDNKTCVFHAAIQYSLQKRILSDRKRADSVFSVVLNGEFAGTKISAEGLFPLQICVIMVLTKSLPPRGRGTALAGEGACVTLGLY
jgi:hypothetical protein